MTQKKLCPRCGTSKPIAEFSKSKKSRDGLQTYCKSCFKERYQETREHHGKLVADRKIEIAKATRPEKKCRGCGASFWPPPDRRGALCATCRNEARKVPCPLCGRPKKDSAKSCRGCSGRNMAGELNPNWKGGSTHTSAGYVQIKVPGRKYVFEHILVMEEHLGRLLVRGENVHHLNGVKCDNRIENLELWRKPQPSGIRAKDALAWAREMIDLYQPLEDRGLI